MLRRFIQIAQLFTLGVTFACLVLLFISQPPPPPPIPVAAPGSTLDPVQAGATIYGSQCESCHGKWGEGVYAPVTIDKAATVAKFPDPSAEGAVVKAGRGQMPAFGDRLSPEQIDAVVAYARTLNAS
jgi:mono/diheme cytochrome c family protein